MIVGIMLGLVPILIFALVDALYSNIRLSVGSAVLFALSELVLIYNTTGRLDPISVLATALFLALGYLSINSNNRVFFKLQPAIISFMGAGILIYMQFFGQPLELRYLPLIKAISPDQMQKYWEDPNFLALLHTLFNWVIVLVFLEGVWIAYAAIKCRQLVWVLVNAFGIWILGILLVIGQGIYLIFFA